jgi:hypothetical protein
LALLVERRSWRPEVAEHFNGRPFVLRHMIGAALRGKRRFIVTVDAPQDLVTALALPTP